MKVSENVVSTGNQQKHFSDVMYNFDDECHNELFEDLIELETMLTE